MSRLATTVAAVVLALLALPASGQEPPPGAELTAPPPGAGWRTVLERAVEASRSSAFEGRLAIISLGRGGPSVAEVDVAQGIAGGMRVGKAEAWMVGREGDDAFFWDPAAGTLLRLGNVERFEFSIANLLDKYLVRLLGSRELKTGPAIVLGIRERGTEHDRERLYVDEATGLVVRRESFDDGGVPNRLVAFTDLRVAELSVSPPEGVEAVEVGALRSVSEDGLRILGEIGWAVPSELGDGFTLRQGYARPEPDGSSLHLVYSDGLYTLSVYQQFGRLDRDVVEGAEAVDRGGLHVWRWPGSEPQRVVWSGADKTFTAISDALGDDVLEAIASFPSDPPPTVRGRLWRGVTRVAGWLWPFG